MRAFVLIILGFVLSSCVSKDVTKSLNHSAEIEKVYYVKNAEAKADNVSVKGQYCYKAFLFDGASKRSVKNLAIKDAIERARKDGFEVNAIKNPKFVKSIFPSGFFYGSKCVSVEADLVYAFIVTQVQGD